MIIGKTRTNQPVEKEEGFDTEVVNLMEQGEPMSGYSFIKSSNDDYANFTYIYAGVVKNGNKLTLVIYLKLTKKASTSTRPILGKFTLPKEVYDKLYPANTFGENTLDARYIGAIDETNLSIFNIMVLNFKRNDNTIEINVGVSTFNALTTDHANLIRVEQTFLLSDNLIPAGE